jgi:hydrogenase maturation protease
MTHPRILIAGIGNIFLGDDAFGVLVAQQLAARDLPPDVRVVDFGIRGYDVAYALLEGYDTAILVDAVPRGGAPGSLYVLEPECDAAPPEGLDGHAMDPVKVLRFAKSTGEPLPRILIVGCEPSPVEIDDMQMEVSAPVREAVGEAVKLVESLVADVEATRTLKASGSLFSDDFVRYRNLSRM